MPKCLAPLLPLMTFAKAGGGTLKLSSGTSLSVSFIPVCVLTALTEAWCEATGVTHGTPVRGATCPYLCRSESDVAPKVLQSLDDRK
jgi:hypothetical protein